MRNTEIAELRNLSQKTSVTSTLEMTHNNTREIVRHLAWLKSLFSYPANFTLPTDNLKLGGYQRGKPARVTMKLKDKQTTALTRNNRLTARCRLAWSITAPSRIGTQLAI